MHEVHARLLAGATGATDPILALHKGIVFLKVCTEPGSQRTLLIDAPAVLGWPKWRERDAKYGFGLLKQAIGAAMRAGLIANHNVDVLAHILLGALTECAMVIARFGDREIARAQAERALGSIKAVAVFQPFVAPNAGRRSAPRRQIAAAFSKTDVTQ